MKSTFHSFHTFNQLFSPSFLVFLHYPLVITRERVIVCVLYCRTSCQSYKTIWIRGRTASVSTCPGRKDIVSVSSANVGYYRYGIYRNRIMRAKHSLNSRIWSSIFRHCCLACAYFRRRLGSYAQLWSMNRHCDAFSAIIYLILVLLLIYFTCI